MDIVPLMASAVGFVGVVLGGLGWWTAREAKQLARTCTRSAAASPAAAPAEEPPAPQPVPAVAALAPGAPRRGATPSLVVRLGGTPGYDLPSNQGRSSGLLGLFLVNDGPTTLRDLQLSATFPNGTTRRSAVHHALSVTKEMTLFAQVVPEDFGPARTIDVRLHVAYRDAHGDQALERMVRVEGGWAGPWQTFLAEDGPRSTPVSVTGVSVD
jgi:hypothetical protein